MVGVLYELATGLFGSAENPYPAFEIMDRGLLESALALPHQPYYETFEEKLAAMVRSIAANHALRDGNKRLALAVLHSTLLVNGYVYLWQDDSAEALVVRCAEGDTDFRWLAEFISIWAPPAAVPLGALQFDDIGTLAELTSALRGPVAVDIDRDRVNVLHEIQLRHARGESSAQEHEYLAKRALQVRTAALEQGA